MSAIDPWTNWEFIEGVVGFYADATGVAAFFLIFFGATFIAMYQSSGSVMLPVVVLIVLAPMTMALVPAVGVQFVAVIMLTMMAVGGFWLYRSLDI